MLAVHNRTRFAAALVPGEDLEGRGLVTLVVKGSFNIDPVSEELAATEEPPELVYADQHYGEPESSSPKYATDALPATQATEVALLGHAYPSGASSSSANVRLEVGPLRRDLVVFGDRHWKTTLGVAQRSAPEPFERMPLTWERSYGGWDKSHPKEKKHGWEPRNPVGRGFAAKGSRQLDGLALPNIEDPKRLVGSPRHRPPPAGLGFIAPHWQPRAGFAGTYDEAWQSQRSPRLPLDFDTRFYRCVPPDMVVAPPLQGGEAVRAAGVRPDGAELCFDLPAVDLRCVALVKGEREDLAPALERVLIEPDELRLSLTWKASIVCGRALLGVEAVVVTAPGFEPPPPPKGNVVELRQP